MKQKIFEEIKEIIKKEKLDIDLKQNEKYIVKEFQDKVDWYNISHYQKLSESFIREFQDKVDWSRISIHQILSESFIREFQDKVEWELINKNKKIIKTKKFQELINRELLIGVLKK